MGFTFSGKYFPSSLVEGEWLLHALFEHRSRPGWDESVARGQGWKGAGLLMVGTGGGVPGRCASGWEVFLLQSSKLLGFPLIPAKARTGKGAWPNMEKTFTTPVFPALI